MPFSYEKLKVLGVNSPQLQRVTEERPKHPAAPAQVTTPVFASGPELSVIVPTFNERPNVRELVERLQACLADCCWEVIFVDDDSTDRTAALVRELAQDAHRIRCIQRIGRRGLSTACIEGMMASSAPYLAVIDGDLQHDETLLPQMLDELRAGDVDVVVGSRYLPGGGIGSWDGSRASVSLIASRLSRLVLKADLADPMSGFFMIRRDAMEGSVRQLSGIGFKILVDFFSSSPRPLRFVELPYEFRSRKAGESKLDSQAAWDYLMLLVDKLIGHLLPVRFVAFSLVGGVGVAVHLAVLAVLMQQVGTNFVTGQTIATLVAMTSNYTLNNLLTYRDRRLKGWDCLRGWFSFAAACGIGAIANVGIASYLFSAEIKWMLAAIAGILVGTVWNFAVTRFYTWHERTTV